MDDDKTERLVDVLGCWLGECIIACYGGQWSDIDGEWGVRFDEANASFPIFKVENHFRYGSEDSIWSYFETIPIVFSKHVKKHMRRSEDPERE